MVWFFDLFGLWLGLGEVLCEYEYDFVWIVEIGEFVDVLVVCDVVEWVVFVMGGYG